MEELKQVFKVKFNKKLLNYFISKNAQQIHNIPKWDIAAVFYILQYSRMYIPCNNIFFLCILPQKATKLGLSIFIIYKVNSILYFIWCCPIVSLFCIKKRAYVTIIAYPIKDAWKNDMAIVYTAMKKYMDMSNDAG